MRYQENAMIGKGERYRVTRVPRDLCATAGSNLHQGEDLRYDGRPVTIRTPRYTNLEIAQADDGYHAGRARFLRMVELLNRVDGVVFSEVLDLFYDRNVAEPFTAPALAQHEPVLVFQSLAGFNLEAFIERRFSGQDGMAGPSHRIHVPRVARCLRRVTLLTQVLHAGGVAHIDLRPEHVLLLQTDEIPRLLGPGHLVLLEDGRIVEDEPNLRFTSLGFAAPELVSATDGWGHGASGEAVMLFGLGAIMLAVVAGGSMPLVERYGDDGPDGLLDLLEELREEVSQDRVPYMPGRLRYLDIAAGLLALEARARLAFHTLDSLATALEELAGDSAADAFIHLECEKCSASFLGDPERNSYEYAGRSFTLCRDCLAGSRTRVTRTAPRCGCEFMERAGEEWARQRVGHQPRQWCPNHRPRQGSW